MVQRSNISRELDLLVEPAWPGDCSILVVKKGTRHEGSQKVVVVIAGRAPAVCVITSVSNVRHVESIDAYNNRSPCGVEGVPHGRIRTLFLGATIKFEIVHCKLRVHLGIDFLVVQ